MKKHNQTIILEDEDIFIILSAKEIELADEGMLVIFQQKGDRKITEREIKEFGDGGFHITIPKIIGDNFETVFIVPAKRK